MEQTGQLDDVFVALGEPIRRQVIDLLKGGPKRAGEIAEAMGMSAAAMSRHLRLLREHGLVQEWHVEGGDARVRLYRLVPYPFQELQGWLEKLAAGWTDELASFKEHAEKKRKRK